MIKARFSRSAVAFVAAVLFFLLFLGMNTPSYAQRCGVRGLPACPPPAREPTPEPTPEPVPTSTTQPITQATTQPETEEVAAPAPDQATKVSPESNTAGNTSGENLRQDDDTNQKKDVASDDSLLPLLIKVLLGLVIIMAAAYCIIRFKIRDSAEEDGSSFAAESFGNLNDPEDGGEELTVGEGPEENGGDEPGMFKKKEDE